MKVKFKNIPEAANGQLLTAKGGLFGDRSHSSPPNFISTFTSHAEKIRHQSCITSFAEFAHHALLDIGDRQADTTYRWNGEFWGLFRFIQFHFLDQYSFGPGHHPIQQ